MYVKFALCVALLVCATTGYKTSREEDQTSAMEHVDSYEEYTRYYVPSEFVNALIYISVLFVFYMFIVSLFD